MEHLHVGVPQRQNNVWQLPSLTKDMNLHIQEAEPTLSGKNQKKNMQSYLTFNILETESREVL